MFERMKKKKIKELKIEVEKLEKIIGSLQGKLDSEKRENQRLHSKLDSETVAKKLLQSDLDSEINKKHNLQSILESEVKEKNDLQKRLTTEISEKEKLLKELESANGRTEKSQKQLSDANQKIDKLQIEIDSVVKINGEMNKEKESVINIYQPIFDSLIKCDSMKSFVRDEMGITSTKSLSIKDSIVLANYIGRGFFFARKIVEHMTEYKKVNTERLTSDEISLIHAINEYYKKADDKNNEIDALDCLGLDIKEKVKYDRKKMRDIREPRNTDFVEAVEMYVPALYMENGGDIEKKALIKGE